MFDYKYDNKYDKSWDDSFVLPWVDVVRMSQSKDGLLYLNLLALFKDGVDSIGESTLTFTSGDASDLMSAQFSFDSGTVTLQLDTLEGGDVFFDSSDSMAPITRYGYEWYALLNTSFAWIGPKGIAGYSVDQSEKSIQIQRYLGVMDYVTIDNEQLTINDSPLNII